MPKTFEERLMDFVGEAIKEGTDAEEVISALEIQLYALKEEHAEDE